MPALISARAEEARSATETRGRVRDFLAAERSAGSFTPSCDSWLAGWDEDFSRRLGRAGLLGLSVPREYGGVGRTALDRYVVAEELLAAGAPVAAHWVADRQIAPTLLRYGSEVQRKEWLPKICRGESYWAIGLSEADAGSDLAAVRTSARAVEDGWLLNGTKVWTSGAHRAHAFFVLARSDVAQGRDRRIGLSQFLVRLDSPGITVRPVLFMTGEHHFNEVVFQDVFVPNDAVVGEIGKGWRQVTSELAYERSGPERLLSTFCLLGALTDGLAARVGDAAGTGHTGERGELVELGELMSRVMVLRQMSLAVANSLASGDVPEVAAALVKGVGTQFEGDVVEAARELLEVEPSPGVEGAAGMLAQALTHLPGFTIRGGTNEILRAIVARGLGVR